MERGAPLNALDALHEGTPLGWALHKGQRHQRLLELLGANKHATSDG